MSCHTSLFPERTSRRATCKDHRYYTDPAAHCQADRTSAKKSIRGSNPPHLTCRSVALPRDRGVRLRSYSRIEFAFLQPALHVCDRCALSLWPLTQVPGCDSHYLVASHARRMYSLVVAQTRACALASHSGTLCRDICSGPVLLRGKSTEYVHRVHGLDCVYPFPRVATVHRRALPPAYCIYTHGGTPRVRMLTRSTSCANRRQRKVERLPRNPHPPICAARNPRESTPTTSFKPRRFSPAIDTTDTGSELMVSLPSFPANHPALARCHSAHKSS